MKTKITVPEKVQLHVEKNNITVEGPMGKIEREFPIKRMEIKREGNTLNLVAREDNAVTKAIVGAFGAHIENMIHGVQEKYVYKLKICSIHFPMSAKVEGSELKISNFLGEKKPKSILIPREVEVHVSGEFIEVKSINIESAGTFSARIEQATKPRRKDRRVFQDGIFMIEKAGQKLE
jgi:large subunit ribosomal protein L6